MASPASVDEYLAALPDDRRLVLEGLRQTIRTAAPDAIETIAYQMPAFRLDGRFFVSYAAFKNHYSLFPASQAVLDALGDEVTPYMAGQGTFRFPAGQPIPLSTVTKIIKVRLVEHAARDAR
jgi:uncharacterized protein YdhG (YjbR/CyaY superfamily)